MGPEGRGTLCNACGLRYRKKLKSELQRRGDAKIPMSALLNTASATPGCPPRASAGAVVVEMEWLNAAGRSNTSPNSPIVIPSGAFS
jgi:hypothetical protein